ncbi:MAG TPA: cupredoxin domain-containing protein [Solirubrobacteraceae bacterium]|nr:cupredoxin domain-containing protein [Solirubrobacteraceae bacterium]
MPRLRLPPPVGALVALAVAAALAGCAHTIRVGASRDLHVALTEYQLTPETARAYAGTLTITVRNMGTRTHNLAISLGNLNEAQSVDLTPGGTTTMTVDLAPGKYMLRSTITGDQSLGLWGSLDVVAIHKA